MYDGGIIPFLGPEELTFSKILPLFIMVALQGFSEIT